MATRSLSRILVASRIVFLLLLALAAPLAIPAIRQLTTRPTERALPIPTPPTARFTVVIEGSAPERLRYHLVELASAQRASDTDPSAPTSYYIRYPAIEPEQPKPDRLPSPIVAAALVASGAMLGALIQYVVVRTTEGRSAERLFP